jgi:hypothetical protein
MEHNRFTLEQQWQRLGERLDLNLDFENTP